MLRPVTLFIGLRYTRAKRRNHFISFISLMSTLGIALGVMVLITVMSVMNGFDREIKTRVFNMVPAITITSKANFLSNWQDLQKLLMQVPEITASAPYVETEVLLTNTSLVQPALIRGILPSEENKISVLTNKMVVGHLADLTPGSFGIILGEDLANHLNVIPGDKITVITPQVTLSPAGVLPRFKRFTVVGIFRSNSGFGFDAMMAFMNMQDAQRLIEMGSYVTGLHVNLKDVYDANAITQELNHGLTSTARISNWTDQFGAFFQAIHLEKTMMFLILLLVIAVAVFNLICSLVMVVTEKEADIAILRTIGATPRMIMQIFIIQGATLGLLGTLLGVLGGIAVATHVTELINGLQHIFHLQLLSPKIFLTDYLPSELRASDVIEIASCALTLSLLATIYPAWRAAKTEPMDALRYE